MVKDPNLPPNAGDTRDAGSVPEWGRSPGGGKWQPTPVFLPKKFHEEPGGPQSTTESDTIEQLNTQTHTPNIK